jgi:hypothetical protein
MAVIATAQNMANLAHPPFQSMAHIQPPEFFQAANRPSRKTFLNAVVD